MRNCLALSVEHKRDQMKKTQDNKKRRVSGKWIFTGSKWSPFENGGDFPLGITQYSHDKWQVAYNLGNKQLNSNWTYSIYSHNSLIFQARRLKFCMIVDIDFLNIYLALVLTSTSTLVVNIFFHKFWQKYVKKISRNFFFFDFFLNFFFTFSSIPRKKRKTGRKIIKIHRLEQILSYYHIKGCFGPLWGGGICLKINKFII